MSYLPTTVAVAMKFVELGKDPEADPAEYAKVISSDSSLSTKLLSLANSSWFGVRNRVTKVQVAVNLLGLGTVRTLAISYCVTGLHNELRLNPEESRMFWTTSLCKAVAAKHFAALHDEKVADEAFAAGLFQDFAMPVMYAASKDAVLPLLRDAALDWKARLQKEREQFRLDHAELARYIAQKLELPELFVDAVAFHHNHASLREFIDKPALADAVYLSSLFPHLSDVWNHQDAEEMRAFLCERGGPRLASPQAFLDSVQAEFNDLYSYFEQGEPPETRLADLLEKATREAADSTTRLVGTMQELVQQAASAGNEVHHLLQQLEEAGARDKLTGALNREGFMTHAGELLAKACRYGVSLAVGYLDIDKFKELNDTFGHAQGDAALRMVASIIRENVRQTDLVARLGGDEFAVLLNDCAQQDAIDAVQRIIDGVASQSLSKPGGPATTATVSAGLVWLRPHAATCTVDELVAMVDALMYEAKRAGGNRLHHRAIPIPAKGAA
jgi:diguanylate cyclase (GGDEF)-like protein